MVKKKKRLLPLGILFLILIFVIALNVFLYIRASKPQNIIIVKINGFGNVSTSIEENVTLRPTEIFVNCTNDEDCDWIITNCCNEEAGAEWQCINKNSYIDCKSKLVLCPNISIPKPKTDCKCMNNTCVGFVFITTQ